MQDRNALTIARTLITMNAYVRSATDLKLMMDATRYSPGSTLSEQCENLDSDRPQAKVAFLNTDAGGDIRRGHPITSN